MTSDPRRIEIDEFLPHPPEKVWRWRTAPGDASRLDSTVTLTLHPEGSGTRLFLVHDGFDPDDPYQAVARRLLGSGWRGTGRRISSVLEERERR